MSDERKMSMHQVSRSLFGIALLTAILNGLLLGILFSLPVCDYFRPIDKDR